MLYPINPYRFRRQPAQNRQTRPQQSGDLFDALEREFQDMFQRLQGAMGDDGEGRGLAQWRNSPAIDFEQEDDAYHLSIEVPGVKSQDLEVNVSDGALTVSGEKRTKREETEDEERCYRERSYGRFSRTIRLPEDVDEENISARFEDGVLEIEIPRNADKKPEARRIEVQSTAGGDTRQKVGKGGEQRRKPTAGKKKKN